MPTIDRSYRALLHVPTLGRVLLSMQIARVAQSMVGIALVLFTLDRYGSPAFAGFVTFASVFPGLLISPIAAALLDRDRHSRPRDRRIDPRSNRRGGPRPTARTGCGREVACTDGP